LRTWLNGQPDVKSAPEPEANEGIDTALL